MSAIMGPIEAGIVAKYRDVRERLWPPHSAIESTVVNRLRSTLSERDHRISELDSKIAELEVMNDDLRRINHRLTESLTAEMLKHRKVVPVPSSRASGGSNDAETKDRWLIITEEVSAKHGVTIIDLRSARRDRKSSRARHECFWRLRKETTMSIPRIGQLFGNRDHTTVLHGIQKHEDRMASGEALRA